MSLNLKYRLGFNEFSSKKDRLLVSLLAEFIGKLDAVVRNSCLGLNSHVPNDHLYIVYYRLGIFLLNFFGVASCNHKSGDNVLIALTFGLVVFMAVMVSETKF